MSVKKKYFNLDEIQQAANATFQELGFVTLSLKKIDWLISEARDAQQLRRAQSGAQNKVRELKLKLEEAQARIAELERQIPTDKDLTLVGIYSTETARALVLKFMKENEDLKCQLSAEREALERAEAERDSALFAVGAAVQPVLNSLLTAEKQRDEARRLLGDLYSRDLREIVELCEQDPDTLEDLRPQLQRIADFVVAAPSSVAEAQPTISHGQDGSSAVAKLKLGRRTGKEDPFIARPIPGDHKKLVAWALRDTIEKHDDLLRALAEVEQREKEDVPFKMLVTREALRERILTDPDMETEAGASHPEARPPIRYIARRGWMPKDQEYAATGTGGIPLTYSNWIGDLKGQIYRIATHDEHGLPVIPRPADAPPEAKYTCRGGYGEVCYETAYFGAPCVDWRRLEDINFDLPQQETPCQKDKIP